MTIQQQRARAVHAMSEVQSATPCNQAVIALYLELLADCLTDSIRPPVYSPLQSGKGGLIQSAKRVAARVLESLLRPARLELVRRVQFTPSVPPEEVNWPVRAETMIGRKPLDQLKNCIEEVLRQNVPGDLIECGVWRGGATIFMRAMLLAYGDVQRRVWVADSFKGLPRPDAATYPADEGVDFHSYQQLAISQDEVKANFSRYGLLDEQVRFLPGWFKDSLPTSPIDRLAVLRADADMYESTIQIMTYLYPKLSIGGYCIVDDYGALPACRQAIDDYRRDQRIAEPLQWVDSTVVWWRRAA